jgi:hypothetical protein
VPELTPATGDTVIQNELLELEFPDRFGMSALDGMPRNARIRATVAPRPGTHHFGLALRGSGNYEHGYELRFSPLEQRVRLRNMQCPINNPGNPFESGLHLVSDLGKPFELDIIMAGSIIDVCIDGRRTLADRVYDLDGDRLFLFCENGQVCFENVTVDREIPGRSA